MATQETESSGSSGSSSGFCGSHGADSLDESSSISNEPSSIRQCYSVSVCHEKPQTIAEPVSDPVRHHLELELDRIATKIRGYSLERVLVESALSHPEKSEGNGDVVESSDISIVLENRLKKLEDQLTGLRAHARVIHYLLRLRSEYSNRVSSYSLHDSLEELPVDETDSLDMTIEESKTLVSNSQETEKKSVDTTAIPPEMRPIIQGTTQRQKTPKLGENGCEKERTFISSKPLCSKSCATCCPILQGFVVEEGHKGNVSLPIVGASERLLKQRKAQNGNYLNVPEIQLEHSSSVFAVVNPTNHQSCLTNEDKKILIDSQGRQIPIKNRLRRKSTYKVTHQHRQEKQNLINEALVKLQIKLDEADSKILLLEDELKKATGNKSVTVISSSSDKNHDKVREKLEKECKILEETVNEYAIKLQQADKKLADINKEKLELTQRLNDKTREKLEKDYKILEENVKDYSIKLEQANLKLSEINKEKMDLIHKLELTEAISSKHRAAIDSELQTVIAEKILLRSKISEMEAMFKILKDRVSEAEKKAAEERGLRLGIQSKLEEMKGRVRVYCKIRPLEVMDNGQNESLAVEVGPNRYTVYVHLDAGASITCSGGRKEVSSLKEFHFDRVFPPDASQEEVFQEARDLIECALDGYNVCICAYGQTGSGKTYTILGGGTEESSGLASRTFSLLFDLSSGNSSTSSSNISRNGVTRDLTVTASVLELYNEKLIDLLRTDGQGEKPEQLEICRSGGEVGGEVWVRGAKCVSVIDANSLTTLVQRAVAHRRTASTGMNLVSSRSHLLIALRVQATCSVTGTVSRGKISLLDLAGSERASRTGATDDRLREAGAINKSLSALGDVIYALATGQSFVPYRNSKLTMLMQDCLGGNAKTLMFVNVSPSASRVDETLTSLVYASRVKHITNTARRAADTKEIARLKKVIKKLQEKNYRCDVDSDLDIL